MRKYHAVVIDGKRLIKYLFGMSLIFLVVLVSSVMMMDKTSVFYNGKITQNILGESVPVISATTETKTSISEKITNTLRKVGVFFLAYDINDRTSIIYEEIPLMKIVSNGYLGMLANGTVEAYNPQGADLGKGEAEPGGTESGEYPIKEVDSGQSKALDDAKKILIRNETTYGINIEEMLKSPLSFTMKKDGAQILILHTHATESYTPEGVTLYSTEKSDRSLSLNENVVKVGEVFKNIFEEKGIKTIHDTTLHDYPNFNGSYNNALKTIEMYKAKNPNIEIVLDIHRDAFIYDDGAKAKFATEINGKKTAQLMFVVGTDAGGLTHPAWRENMKLALKLQESISKKYPNLMRGVNLRKERFNGHTTKGSLIIEVGSSGNTLAEAINGATLGAEAIADFLNTLE